MSDATYLLGLLVFSVLHYEVNVAQHGLDRVGVCEVERQKPD